MSFVRRVRDLIWRVIVLLGLEKPVFNWRFSRPKKHAMNELQLAFNLLALGSSEKVMIDVGAHFGESAFPFLLNGWTVHSFEPDPSVQKKLKLESLRRRFEKFFLYTDAVSDVDGKELVFYSSEESTGVSSLIPFTKSHEQTCVVHTRTLRSFVAENSVSAVALLKIDTEGNDLMVLKGFPFEEVKPLFIIAEFEDSKTRQVGYSYKELGDFLLAQGYVVYLSEWYPVTKYGVAHRWRTINPYPCELHDEAAWGNFLAFSPDLEDSVRAYCSGKLGVGLID